MNRQILEYITTYLEENKEEYNYLYIFGKSFGSVVLYGNSAFDITQQVLEGLNLKYQDREKIEAQWVLPLTILKKEHFS